MAAERNDEGWAGMPATGERTPADISFAELIHRFHEDATFRGEMKSGDPQAAFEARLGRPLSREEEGRLRVALGESRPEDEAGGQEL